MATSAGRRRVTARAPAAGSVPMPFTPVAKAKPAFKAAPDTHCWSICVPDRGRCKILGMQVEFCPNRAGSGRNRPKFCRTSRIRSEPDLVSPMLGQIRLTSAKCSQSWTQLDRNRPIRGRIRPLPAKCGSESTNVGQFGPASGRLGPNLGQILANSARSGPASTKSWLLWCRFRDRSCADFG